MDTKAEALAVQERTYDSLGCGVSSPYTRHVPASVLPGDFVYHTSDGPGRTLDVIEWVRCRVLDVK